jgi:hypothetical protein
MIAVADEARDGDGRRTSGTLTLDAAGRLQFTPAGQDKPAPPDGVDMVLFKPAAPAPFRIGFVRRVLLDDGQRISGRLLGVDKDAVCLRTAWAERVTVPRAAAVALLHPAGWQTVLDDDFADLQSWTCAGKPALSAGDAAGPPAVTLAEPGQSLAYAVAEPPDAGRVGVNFLDKDAAGALWRAALRFQGDGGERIVTVTLAGGGDAYEVEVPRFDGEARRVPRSPGWHRLTVQFGKESLRVLCDDDVLWYSLKQGPGGTLRQVAFSCVEAKPAAPRGTVALAEFSLVRAVDETRLPPGDPGQDEVLLAGGDQLFGDVVRADRRAVEIQGRFGKRSLSWADVRGCRFHRDGAPPRPPAAGARARVWIDSGVDTELDVLEGVVKALDNKTLLLVHPVLGEQRIDRDRVRRLKPLPRGRD